MTQGEKRSSTRTRKPPRFLQSDETQYDMHSGMRFTDNRESRSGAQETNQLAKILVKFSNNLNTKFRDHHNNEAVETNRNANHHYDSLQAKRENIARLNEKKPNYSGNDPTGSIPRKNKDLHQRAVYEAMRLSARDKKNHGLKGSSSGNLNIQSDLDYHELINEHIKQSFPDIKSLSQQALMELGIPKHLLEQQQLAAKGGQFKETKKKKQFTPVTIGRIVQKDLNRDDLKPFKRQSYHIAIAYHIHLKNVRASGSSNSNQLDPTYNAKKLREQANQQVMNNKNKPKKKQEKKGQNSQSTPVKMEE